MKRGDAIQFVDPDGELRGAVIYGIQYDRDGQPDSLVVDVLSDMPGPGTHTALIGVGKVRAVNGVAVPPHPKRKGEE